MNNNHKEKEEMQHEDVITSGGQNEEQPASAVQPPHKDRFLAVSIVIAAVLIGGALVFSAVYKPAPADNSGDGGNGGTAQTGPSTDQVAKALQLTSSDVVLGDAKAPVTVIEYGDYQCPFCTQYFKTIQPVLVSKYVNTGKIKFVFRNFPFLDRFPGLPQGANESHDAGAAALCAADQGKFWQFHDALYGGKAADESQGGGENDGYFTRTRFANMASQLGMNIATFSSCLVSGKYTDTVNQEYAAASQDAGVNSTPTTFVNGMKVVDSQGNSAGLNLNAIQAAIDAALKA